MKTLSIGFKPKAKPTLRFDADQHRYWLGDRELPSVTTVLKSAGLIDTSHYTAGDAALRGTYVHEAVAMTNLDEDALDSCLRGYVKAWRVFMEENVVAITFKEERVCHPTYSYAGTYDCLGTLDGEWWLLDVKTGVHERWHGLQTAAYMDCIPYTGKHLRRGAVHLKPDGTYKMVVHADPDDLTVFRAALNIYHWKGKR